MIIKFANEELWNKHLASVFKRIWQYNMTINPEKCTFSVIAGKFVVFLLIGEGHRGEPKEVWGNHKMEEPSIKKELMQLNGMLITLNIFISNSPKHVFSFYKLLNK